MGVGAGRLPVSLVSPDLATGKLVLWGDVEGPGTALWALYPTRRLLSARVSAFLEYLREAFPQGTPDELAAYLSK
jgi:DNA-binding transcriptional LysR family regulator